MCIRDRFKATPREIDPTLTVPFHKRTEYIADTPKNRRLQAKMISFEKKIAKRFKEYHFKKRKDKIKDLSKSVDSIYVDSQTMAKRYNLMDYIPPEEHEDDDDVDEAPPKKKQKQILVHFSVLTRFLSHQQLQCHVSFHTLGNVQYYAVYSVSLKSCLLYTSPSPRDGLLSRMPSSA
eukprot:TRINITY_DN2767_c0_g1_i13.p2 TRINITY_DN2767_c0_g1~~TRINITY_DN2767_c0_g1_i13.p2  ORF type:complete len:197 (+),score=55.85 TRINITY_DN2767_c0_g1_i13:61-591(+)